MIQKAGRQKSDKKMSLVQNAYNFLINIVNPYFLRQCNLMFAFVYIPFFKKCKNQVWLHFYQHAFPRQKCQGRELGHSAKNAYPPIKWAIRICSSLELTKYENGFVFYGPLLT